MKIQNISSSNKNKLGILSAIVLLFFFSSYIMKQPHTFVGVINMERVREMAEPYKEIEREKEKYTQIWRTKFRAEQEILDEEDKQLAIAQKNKSMKKKAFKVALDNLQKKSLALQKKYQKEATKIMMASNSVEKQIDELTLLTIEEVANKMGYDIVLTNALYAASSIDITHLLIDELNKKSIKINYPDPETLTPNDE
ncbi:MAG: OmpH family outer membrane protein [Alphaproteobacteria bacterium]|nr:OmpH family outer membrane protein [Alphaproteobacteria bacterium]